MNVIAYKTFLAMLLGVVIFMPVCTVQADELGRLFLTSKERAKLEKFRYAKPEPVEQPKAVVMPEPEDPGNAGEAELPEMALEETPVLTKPVILKGVVKRANGKNTAWINDTNTNEAGSVLDQIELHDSDIGQSSVKVTLPDNVTNLTLKVGQTYDPDNDPAATPDNN